MKHHECVVAVVLMSLATLSAAQSTDRVEVFGGFSYIRPDFTDSVSGGVPGWNVSASVRLFRYLRVVGDFSGFSPSGPNPCAGCGGGPFASYHTFMGGPQVSMRFGPIKPFARFLLGDTKGSLTHADEQFGGDFSHFTAGVGGGVDLGLNRWIAVRVQADWLHIAQQFSSTNNMARVSTGMVFRF
jgi:hypothetical protein